MKLVDELAKLEKRQERARFIRMVLESMCASLILLMIALAFAGVLIALLSALGLVVSVRG